MVCWPNYTHDAVVTAAVLSCNRFWHLHHSIIADPCNGLIRSESCGSALNCCACSGASVSLRLIRIGEMDWVFFSAVVSQCTIKAYRKRVMESDVNKGSWFGNCWYWIEELYYVGGRSNFCKRVIICLVYLEDTTKNSNDVFRERFMLWDWSRTTKANRRRLFWRNFLKNRKRKTRKVDKFP